MTKYSQRDSRWGNINLGYGSTKISSYGCVITALAQLLLLNGHNETPATVNDKLKANNGFTTDGNKNLIMWNAIQKAFKAKHVVRAKTYNNSAVADAIKKYGGCLVEVNGQKIGAPIHWVLYIGNQKMIDPWTGTERATSYYPAIGYSVVSVEKVTEPTPSKPLKDTVIDWDDAEVKRKTVGWYVREWAIEKQRANDREWELGEVKSELAEVREKDTEVIRQLNQRIRELNAEREDLIEPTPQNALKILFGFFGGK